MNYLTIIYRRLPDQITLYKHELVYKDGGLIVTRAPFRPSKSLMSQLPELRDLEYRAIWYVFDGKWHDLGAIYHPSGKLEGYYCDMIRPAKQTKKGLEIDDLFLDLWVFPSRRYLILDENEFEEAIKLGWLKASTADRVRQKLEKLIHHVEDGRFPPPMVERFKSVL